MLGTRSCTLLVLVCLTSACGSRSSIGLRAGDGSADRTAPDGRSGEPAPLPAGWLAIPPGTFTMGSPKSEPCREAGSTRETQHPVTISSGFLIASIEVTQQQFQDLRGYAPSRFTRCGPTCPVEQVSWHEAVAYCNALSKAEGLALCYDCKGTSKDLSCAASVSYQGKIHTCPGYRLPTEAEWEYAYRAGTTTALYVGPIGKNCDQDPLVSEVGWYAANSGGTPHPVGKKKANAWGLSDMAGNVWEWVHDGYQDDLGSAPVTDPQDAASSLSRVLRGSSWLDTAGHLRAADRFGYPPASRNSNIGFRCARRE